MISTMFSKIRNLTASEKELQSQIGWLFFSKHDRELLDQLLDIDTDENVLDELGVGVLRDIISNRLFPGTATNHTRAKYYFFFPYILYDYQRKCQKNEKPENIFEFVKKKELDLRDKLSKIYGNDSAEPKEKGIIGITKARRDIRILPSEIYWSGIREFQLIKVKRISRIRYLSILQKLDLVNYSQAEDDSDNCVNNLGINVPPPSHNWMENLSITLNSAESNILQERIIDNVPNSLFPNLFTVDQDLNEFNFREFANIQVAKNEIDGELIEILRFAHDLSLITDIVYSGYNLLLQQSAFGSNSEDDWRLRIDDYRSQSLSQEFNVKLLFQKYFRNTLKSPIVRNAIHFIDDFVKLLRSDNFNMSNELKQRIINRERVGKGPRARLYNGNHSDVKENQRLGLKNLQFRYDKAKYLVSEIIEGKKND